MNLWESLYRYGQSVWLDEYERSWVISGQLKQYIEENGLRGVRSNFQSLQVAIRGQEYNRDFRALAQQSMSRSVRADYDYLIVRDLQLAADLLKQVHSQTQGQDGYVQIDLPPDELLEAETAIAAAQKIWQSVGWSNLLLRVPATQLMLPVIEQLISDRINVSATLVFTQMMYEQVLDAYLKGLERLIRQGDTVSDVACFTSFPIGRLDTAIDPLIATLETSFGMIQAKLLYQHYRNLHQSVGEAFPLGIRWRSLRQRANPLRLVWDCTGILPQSAWRYLQTLAAPGTVMMLSPSVLEMYREVSLLPTNLINDEPVAQILTSISRMEISLDELVNRLVNEERARSHNAFCQLLDAIEQKRIRSSLDV